MDALWSQKKRNIIYLFLKIKQLNYKNILKQEDNQFLISLIARPEKVEPSKKANKFSPNLIQVQLLILPNASISFFSS